MGTPTVDQTDASFADAFAELKRASGKSFRDLAAELAELDGRGLSPSFLSALAKGVERPAPGTIANIARVFGKDARYFAEYRLAQLRALLDEGGETGLDGALSVAREIEPGLQSRVVDVDPAKYPHAMPIGCGPRMRRQRSRAAA
jgi:transcriptional regulator with XRE-family HTH domain